jgi:hypothetical protein
MFLISGYVQETDWRGALARWQSGLLHDEALDRRVTIISTGTIMT